MPSEPWEPNRREQRAADILSAIGKIGKHLGGVTRDAFLGDDLRQDAVLHQLLVIAEACDKIEEIERKADLPADQKLAVRQRDVPWRKIRDMGIRIRHIYGTIEPELVWEVCKESTALPQLRTALEREFPQLHSGR